MYRICVTSRVKEKKLGQKGKEGEVKMNVSNIEMCFNEKCSQCAWPIIRVSRAERRAPREHRQRATERERERDIVCDSSKWMTLLLSPVSTDSSMHAE